MTPAQEERRAHEQLRRLAKARRARERKLAQARRRALTDAIRTTRKQHPSCTCELHAGMTERELIDAGSGCCDRYICPRLDRVRRAVGI